MANVWSYWKCPSCNKIIRGDLRTCVACGTPIPAGIKYLMPNHPEVIDAMSKGKIITEASNTKIDKKGIKSEIVPSDKVSKRANWICSYCNCQNAAENIACERCGAGKEESEKNYFNRKTVLTDKEVDEAIDRTGNGFLKEEDDDTEAKYTDENEMVSWTRDAPDDFEYAESDNDSSKKTTSEKATKSPEVSLTPEPSILDIIKQFICDYKFQVAGVFGIIFLIIFLFWLFTPITRESKIIDFSWNRQIDVEEFTLCHEDGWDVPNGATVTDTRQEIHHYDHVIDHYETKTRQVSHQEFDGYDTSYVDLGNGQAEVVETPVYRTVWETEEYEDPVYVDVPVYKTKYYYDIGRWQKSGTLCTAANDHKPYWEQTDIPEEVDNPNYGDKRLGSRKETYYIYILDSKEQKQKIKYKYDQWQSLSINDKITYKTFRFSDTPL